eukprot:364283-Chlamydomonas_euryale.AAC.6
MPLRMPTDAPPPPVPNPAPRPADPLGEAHLSHRAASCTVQRSGRGSWRPAWQRARPALCGRSDTVVLQLSQTRQPSQMPWACLHANRFGTCPGSAGHAPTRQPSGIDARRKEQSHARVSSCRASARARALRFACPPCMACAPGEAHLCWCETFLRRGVHVHCMWRAPTGILARKTRPLLGLRCWDTVSGKVYLGRRPVCKHQNADAAPQMVVRGPRPKAYRRRMLSPVCRASTQQHGLLTWEMQASKAYKAGGRMLSIRIWGEAYVVQGRQNFKVDGCIMVQCLLTKKVRFVWEINSQTVTETP